MSTDNARLVEQISRTRAELAEALADPDLTSDRLRYAEVTRRWSAPGRGVRPRRALRGRGGPRPRGRGDARRGGRPRGARAAGGGAGGARVPRREHPRGHDRARPRRRPQHDRRDPRGHRRRGGGALRARPARRLHALRRVERAEGGAAVDLRGRRGRPARGDAGREGLRRLRRVQARGGRPPGAAGAGHREPGPHAHLRRHGRGAARGGGGRRHDRSERREARRVPVERPGRARASTPPTPRCG